MPYRRLRKGMDFPFGETEHTAINSTYHAGAFDGADGGEQINNALTAASSAAGHSAVVVGPAGPDTNGRWVLGSAVEVPANTTLVLNNSYLQLADDAQDNIIRNKDLVNRTANIHVYGVGNVRLDGNAASHTVSDTGDHRSVGVLFHKVDGWSLRNVTLGPCLSWALSPQDVTDGHVDNLEFAQDGSKPNQDGMTVKGPIDGLRATNLSGTTEDDFIGLNSHDNQDFVVNNAGGGHLKNITIDTIRTQTLADGTGHPVRVLLGDGYVARNINLRNITVPQDAARPDGGYINVQFDSRLTSTPTQGDIDVTVDGLEIEHDVSDPIVYFESPVGEFKITNVTVHRSTGSSFSYFLQDSTSNADIIEISDVTVDVDVLSTGMSIFDLNGGIDALRIRDSTIRVGNPNASSIFGIGGAVDVGEITGIVLHHPDHVINWGGTANRVLMSDITAYNRSGTYYRTMPASGLVFGGGTPEVDVRNLPVATGSQAPHDGTGTGNPRGPAYCDGTSWISLVDGTTIA